MNHYIIIIAALVSAIVWYRVSAILFSIHHLGIEVSYTLKYKSTYKGTTEERKRKYYLYIATLWGLEVFCGVGTLIFVALLLGV